jgi:LppX_LprAFG lipoprotein
MRTGVCVAGSALVLTPVALTGCGGGTRSLETVTKAAAKTANQPSEHMTIYATITTDGRVSTVRGSGDFRNRPLRGRMAVDVGAVGAGDITVDEIVSDSVAYLASDGFFGELPPGIEWMAVDYGEGAAASVVDTASTTSRTPTESLALLNAAGAAEKIGREDVDGVEATHYAATIDPAKISAGVVRASHPRYGTVDVWIDGQGLVRQEMVVLSETVQRSHVSASMKLDFSGFGEHVSVQAPSAGDTSGASQFRLNAILNGGP